VPVSRSNAAYGADSRHKIMKPHPAPHSHVTNRRAFLKAGGLIAGGFLAPSCTRTGQSAGDTVIVHPVPTTDAVVNPGKGWILYGRPEKQAPGPLELCSLGYTRYAWSQIEPLEGVYRWDVIDDDIKSWTDTGRQYAFGIRNAASGSKEFWVSPKWVFDAGARYDTYILKERKSPVKEPPGPKLVPVFDDPVFMQKLERFIHALAARYDGNPDIAFIDIRSYGNYGEGHLSPFNMNEISAAKYREHVQLHLDAFRKTRLVLPVGNRNRADFEPVFDWAVSSGISLRRDGICGNSDGSEVRRCAGRLPAVFELYGKYGMLKEQGWWDGRKDAMGRGYRLEDCVETGMPTFCDLSRGEDSALEFVTRERELVERMANRLGYHFVLTKAIYPASLSSKRPGPVSLEWENRGVAHIFISAKVSFALMSSDGKVVCVSDALADPSTWRPGLPITVNESLSFNNAPAGDYVLAVGLRRPLDDLRPSIRIGIRQRSESGWHELGPVTVKPT